MSMIDSLFDRAERYRRFSAQYRSAARHKQGEHKQLMDAVLERRSKEACELQNRHVQGTLQYVTEVLERHPATLQ